MARISYPDEEIVSEDFKKIYRQFRGRDEEVLNIMRVMSHSPNIGFKLLRLGNAILFKGMLPKTLRELAILRVGNLYGANYEWTQHKAVALRVGVKPSQIEALPGWRNSTEFDAREKAVLDYTDELTLHIRVADETFRSLRAFLSEEEVVELTAAVGYYGMICRILEAFQVELEKQAE